MNITGIEVIRRNPGVVPVGVVAGETLPVEVGDTVRVHLAVDYRGPETDGAIWTAIGWQVGVVIEEFIEVFNSRTPVHFDASADFVTYQIDCDVPITDITGFPIEFGLYGNILDMYAKITEVPGPDIFTDICMGAIEVIEVEPPPEYELIQHTISHFAYIYDGDVDLNVATFKIDPFTPSAWAAQKFADALESEARKKGARVLETKVYVDTTPLFWTDIRIEVTGTPLGEGVGTVAGRGIAVGIAPWLAIILVCLAIIAVIIVATLAFEQWMQAFKKKPGLHEVKQAWGKEALILDIQDAEEYWERTPTPPEELEGKSEEELRDLLDQIAEEELPPVTDMWPLLLLGGLGVVGVGGIAAAYAMSKPAGK